MSGTQQAWIVPNHFIARESSDFAECRINIDNCAILRGHQDSVPGVSKYSCCQLQFGFILLALGDVVDDGEQSKAKINFDR